MGAIGPKRVVFNEDGTPPAPPAQLVDNRESWLAFTDLVFIDPIGTGFSRATEQEPSTDSNASNEGSGEGSGKQEGQTEPEREFYGFKRDLESLGEFIRSFLSEHKRWNYRVSTAVTTTYCHGWIRCRPLHLPPRRTGGSVRFKVPAKPHTRRKACQIRKACRRKSRTGASVLPPNGLPCASLRPCSFSATPSMSANAHGFSHGSPVSPACHRHSRSERPVALISAALRGSCFGTSDAWQVSMTHRWR